MVFPLMPMHKAAMLELKKKSDAKYCREAVKRIVHNVYKEVIDTASKNGGTLAKVKATTYGVEGYDFDIVASMPDIINDLEPLFPGSKITYNATATSPISLGTEDVTALDSKIRSTIFIGSDIVDFITVDWS